MSLAVDSGPPPDLGAPIWQERVPSRIDLKVPLNDRLVAQLRRRGWVGAEEEHWLSLCLDEAVVNAMLHGNEGDPGLSIRLRLHDDAARWVLFVEDDGEGFSPDDVPDPDDERSLMLEHGRGIMIMLQWLDELRYFRRGSCAMLARRKDREEELT